MDHHFDSELKITELLERFRGQTAFFDELSGNNGDDLISDGARHSISAAGLSRTNISAEADLLVVTGGAGLSSVWGGAYEQMRQYTEGNNNSKPLIILPSTISIETFDLPRLLGERTAPSWIFARERMTLGRIQAGGWNATTTLAIDNDMAFHLDKSAWLRKLKDRQKQDYLLIVERRDAEGLSGPSDKAVPVPAGMKQWIPMSIKRPIKRRLHEKQRANTPFAQWAKDTAIERLELDQAVPVRAIDASLKGLLTFEQFANIIARATAVVTTRLHVGILADLLEKPTLIIPGDAKYGKIQGIYEYSMTSHPHVELVENPFAKPS